MKRVKEYPGTEYLLEEGPYFYIFEKIKGIHSVFWDEGIFDRETYGPDMPFKDFDMYALKENIPLKETFTEQKNF